MSETETKPLVSVVITVRNAEAFISETLASILQERDVPFEVVLIDNGCTDGTIERVNAFNDERVRVLKGPEKGIAHALNVAYAAARGEIIMRCDGDDLYPPGRLRRQSKWLADHPDFGAVCGSCATIDAKGNPLLDVLNEEEGQEITEELLNAKIRFHIGTFAIRAEALRAAGGSREYFDCFEDFDFQLRVGETCRVWFEPKIEYIYRLHQNSSTHSTSNAKKEFYNSVAFEFQRQRQTQGTDDLQRGCPPVLPEGNYKSSPWDAAGHVQQMLLASAWSDHEAGDKQQALVKGVRSVMALPMRLEAWRSLVALALKPAGKKSAP
jgi:glycosyltransferase involved in cell wall biosynthesis